MALLVWHKKIVKILKYQTKRSYIELFFFDDLNIENKKNPPNFFKGFKVLMWYLQESNQGHKDFQSFALPTELRYHD